MKLRRQTKERRKSVVFKISFQAESIFLVFCLCAADVDFLFQKLRRITTNLLNNVSECLPVTATVCLVVSRLWNLSLLRDEYSTSKACHSIIDYRLSNSARFMKQRTNKMFNFCRFLIPVSSQISTCQNRREKIYCYMLSLRYTPTLNSFIIWCFVLEIPFMELCQEIHNSEMFV